MPRHSSELLVCGTLFVATLTGCAHNVVAAGTAATTAAPAAATAVAAPVERVIPVSSPQVSAAGTAAQTGPQPPTMMFKGTMVQGGLLIGRVDPGTRMFLDEKPLHVGRDGTVIFALDRDAAPTFRLRVQRPDGLSFSSSYNVQQRTYDIQHVEGISERQMNPHPEDEERIGTEGEFVRSARLHDDERMDFKQKFIWPAHGPISGVYGSQRFYNGVPKRPHYGVDMAVPIGTDVVAPAAGIVTLSLPDMFYSGGTLIIDHGFGLTSTLMHLSQLLVNEGDRVEQGQVVAKSGATGRASGPHVDWRMNWLDDVRVDPQLLVPPMDVAPANK